MLAGKEALFKVQLTQVQDGCVLGFSFCHGLSGERASIQTCAVERHTQTNAKVASGNPVQHCTDRR